MARTRVVASVAARVLRAGWWICRHCPWAPVGLIVFLINTGGDLSFFLLLFTSPLDFVKVAVVFAVVGVFLCILWNLLLEAMWGDRERPDKGLKKFQKEWNKKAATLEAEQARTAAALEAAQHRALAMQQALELEYRRRQLEGIPVEVTVLGEIEEGVRSR